MATVPQDSCITNPFPSFESLSIQFGKFQLPSLGTFPKPFFGAVNITEFAVAHWIVELQNMQLGAVIITALKTVSDILGINWSSLLPAIPGLSGINIMDFISGNFQKIVDAIKVALAGNGIPSFPTPIFGAVSVPDIEIWHIIQELYTNSIKAVADIVIAKIKDVVDLIKNTFGVDLGALSLPEFPTKDVIIAKLKLAMKEIPPKIDFTGFPTFYVSTPLYGSPVVSFDISIVKEIPKIMLALLMTYIKPVTDLIQEIVKYIGAFKMPHLCVNETSGVYFE